MRSYSFFIAAILWVASSTSSMLPAQDELDEFVERDSAAFIVIQDPEAILQQIESSPFFQNLHFQRALELMVDGEFPLADHERLDDLKEKWYEARDLLNELDEISLIIHSWADDYLAVPKISIALTSTDESNQRLKGLLADIESLLLKSEPDAPNFLTLFGGSALQGWSIQHAKNLILVSNAPSKSRELMTRLERSKDRTFRSLARNRSYLMVQKLLQKRADSPQVRGFLAPKSFRRLITSLVAGNEVIMLDPPASIASSGFQVLLQNDGQEIATPDGMYRPIINSDFVLTYTYPASAFGKLIESFEPFEEFPSLPFSVTSLAANGFDLQARHNASKEIFEKYQKHLFAPANEDDPSVGMSFEKYFSLMEFGLSGATDKLDMNPMLEAASGTISVYHEGNSIHWKPAMKFQRVKSREAMEKLVTIKLKAENRSVPEFERLVEIPNEHGRLFGRTERGIREYLKRREKNLRDSGEELPKGFALREGKPLSETILSRQYEYFINDEWMIHCDHNSMRRFLTAAYEKPPTPQTFDLLLKATKRSSGQNSFFRIAYQSNKFYRVENKRMQSSFESVRIKEKYGSGAKDWSPEAWKILMSEPDRYGLRNEIESKEDAAAAIQELIFHAFNDTFGTSVRLYSKGDRRMRIFAQVYSLVDE